MIRDAEIMLRSAAPQQRERGREILREVIDEAQGSIYAKKAREMLTESERPTQERVDPELDELISQWPSIQGFNDYRLARFLRRLESYPGVAVPLRTDVIRELRGWIVDALPQVRPGAPPAQIAALNDFVAAVRGVAAYEVLPEFGQLRDGLFHLRLQETATRVDESLKIWVLDKAQQLLDEFVPFPDAFKANVERLQADVYEVDSLRRAVKGLLRELPAAAPSNWIETRMQVELLQQIGNYLPHPRVPQEWQSKLEDARACVSAFVEQFVRAQAQAAVTIEHLREFWTEFNRLPPISPGCWQVSEDWFPHGMEALAADTRRGVERARHPDDLTALAKSLRVDMEGVPPAMAARMSEMADAIDKNAVGWKAMRDGQVFQLPSSGPAGFPVPDAWHTEAARYMLWLQQIETVTNAFKNETPPPSEEDYQDGLRLAKEILEQAPGHALAHKLQLEAERRISCYQLDQALAGWRLETFFELFKTNNPGEIYAALKARQEVLFELRALTHQAQLRDWQAAAKWWAAWQVATKRLPSAKPDALIEALDEEAAKRHQEWYAILDRLLQDNLSPQEYEAAAASLEGEAVTNLQTYQQELQRKATISRIEQHIKSQRLAEAERELIRSLPPESTDAGRLRTQLRMEQARARGSAAAAEYLLSDWENVKSYVARPQLVLLQTIKDVWAEDEQEWVNKLAQLLSRVLAREEAQDETTGELTAWQTWLEIEDSLRHNFSTGGVKQLADYLRKAEPGPLLDQCLKKILRHWQNENNTVMLAWAYQAFSRKSKAAEQFNQATDNLSRESDQVAEHVLSVLAEREELELDDLKPLHDSLQREEGRWRLLDDLLSLYLPHHVEHRQPSPKFDQAKASVGELTRILSLLGRLKEADLRQQAARQDFDDAYARARRLKGIGIRARLLKEMDRLRPLKEEIFSLEQRIRETAERCRSRAALDVLEPGLFNQLAGYVRKVVETFVTAKATESAMWWLMSSEYETLIYREAGVLLPMLGRPRLDRLADTLEGLHAEELVFTEAIALLEDRDRQPKVPWSAAFNPQLHLDYLQLIPAREPSSLKVYHRFERARRDTLKIILEAPDSLPHLPPWVREYLDKGVPACTNER